MAKKFRDVKCIYCLEQFDKLTSDHIFPKSWYPKTTPKNMEKAQAPCCFKCNQKYSKVEQRLLETMAICFEPDDASSLGLREKALKGLNPNHAKSKKDREVRRKKRKRLFDSLKPARHELLKHALPGFDSCQGYPIETMSTISISHDDLKSIGEKFVRGILYILEKTYVTENHEIEVVFAKPENAKPFEELLKEHGTTFHSGPGFLLSTAIVQSDKISSLHKILIWGRFLMYISVNNIESKNKLNDLEN